MSELDANIDLVERYFADVMNEPDPDPAVVATLLTPDFIVHHSLLPGGRGGAAAVGQLMRGFRAAFSNLHYDVQDRLAQGDRVAVRWLANADHAGVPFFGVPAKQPPVHVSVGGTDVFRIVNGRLAETWVCSDMLSLAIQLGALQPPAAAPAPVPAAP